MLKVWQKIIMFYENLSIKSCSKIIKSYGKILRIHGDEHVNCHNVNELHRYIYPLCTLLVNTVILFLPL